MTDIRQAVESHLDGIPADPERLKKLHELLDYALEPRKKVWVLVKCPHCTRSKKHLVEVPESSAVTAAVKALTGLIEATKGKVPIEVSVRHEFDTLHVRELPTEELHRIAAREVVDAEYEDVTPVLALPSSTD